MLLTKYETKEWKLSFFFEGIWSWYLTRRCWASSSPLFEVSYCLLQVSGSHYSSEDEGTAIPRNLENRSRSGTALHLRRLESSTAQLWKSKISLETDQVLVTCVCKRLMRAPWVARHKAHVYSGSLQLFLSTADMNVVVAASVAQARFTKAVGHGGISYKWA